MNILQIAATTQSTTPDNALRNLIIGASIAFIGSIMAPIIHRYFERNNEKKAIKAAFLSEIRGLHNIFLRGKYRKGLQDAVASMKETNKIYIFKFRVKRDYFLVYQNNASKIGLLEKDIAADIPELYLTLFSGLEDVDALYENEHQNDSIESMLNLYEVLDEKFEIFESKSEELIKKLSK